MRLEKYRRPPNDTGIGFHFTANASDGDTLWLVKLRAQQTKEMHASWLKGMDFSYQATQEIIALGLEPILRVYIEKPGQWECTGGLLNKYDIFLAAGGKYCDPIWNEVNVFGEMGNYPNPRRIAELWVPFAQYIVSKGGYPGTPSLSPGAGDQFPGGDIGFLEQFCDRVNELDPTIWGKGVFIGVHNYTLNHPPTYTEDRCGFLGYRMVNDVILAKTGRQLPMVSTEGGTVIGNRDDGRYPEVTPEIHSQWSKEIAEYCLIQAEPWLFCGVVFWLISNDMGNPVWNTAAWYKNFDTGLPAIDALRNMSIQKYRTLGPVIEQPTGGTAPMPMYKIGNLEVEDLTADLPDEFGKMPFVPFTAKDFISIHHTATSATATAKAIYDYHIGLGFGGIGYNFLVFEDGKIQYVGECNKIRAAVGQISQGNYRGIHIAMVWNTATMGEPPPKMLAAVKSLAANIQHAYGNWLPIVPHRLFNSGSKWDTECPGKNWLNWWPQILRAVGD